MDYSDILQDISVDLSYMIKKHLKNIKKLDSKKQKEFTKLFVDMKNGVDDLSENVVESINEISAIGGLKQVVKGNTKEVEGIKLSKEMAQAMIDWFNSSPYGRKYPKAAKARLHLSLGIMSVMGLDRYAKHKGAKEELKYIKTLAKAMREDTIKHLEEAKFNYKQDAMNAYMKGKLSAEELDKIAKNDFKSSVATKKELQNFLDSGYMKSLMANTYGLKVPAMEKKVKELMKFAS